MWSVSQYPQLWKGNKLLREHKALPERSQEGISSCEVPEREDWPNLNSVLNSYNSAYCRAMLGRSEKHSLELLAKVLFLCPHSFLHIYTEFQTLLVNICAPTLY